MTLDQTILLWCVTVPALIAGLSALVALRVPPRVQPWLTSLGWWIAVAAAMAGCHRWQWWPDDAWRRSLWPILGWALLWPATCGRSPSWRWVLAGTLASLTAMAVIPSGEQWRDTYWLHRIWMAAVATSCLLNAFAIELLTRRGAERWSLLVVVAALGGPLALAASCYASLAAWTLAVIVATLVVAVIASLCKLSGAAMIACPCLAAASSITASGRFYTYADNASWIYALMLYLPLLIVVVDFPIRDRSTRTRVAAAGVTSGVVVGASVWYLLLA